MYNITRLLEMVMNLYNGHLICCFRDDAFEEKLTSFISRKADLLFKKKERRSDPPQSFRNEHGTILFVVFGSGNLLMSQ